VWAERPTSPGLINRRASCCLLVGYNLNLNARCTKPTVTAYTDKRCNRP